jgi:hypothetical protein
MKLSKDQWIIVGIVCVALLWKGGFFDDDTTPPDEIVPVVVDIWNFSTLLPPTMDEHPEEALRVKYIFQELAEQIEYDAAQPEPRINDTYAFEQLLTGSMLCASRGKPLMSAEFMSVWKPAMEREFGLTTEGRDITPTDRPQLVAFCRAISQAL